MAKRPPRAAATSTDTSEQPFAPPEWPALDRAMRKVSALIANPHNARAHSPEQVSMLAASLKKFGLTKPILIDEADMILAGHGTTLAAKEAGIEEVAVCIARGWPEEKKRAYVIADNQLALQSEWSDDLLRRELDALRIAGWDMESIGWSADALDDFLALGLPPPPEPPIPPVPKNPVTRLGDVWVLGKSRVMCGDCRNANAVDAIMAGEKIAVGFTSPPTD